LSRWESWGFGLTQVLLAATGFIWFYMEHALETDDPFAIVNHPWQPTMLAIHVLVAPLALLLFGVVLRSHVLAKLAASSRVGRRSGWLTLASFGLMAASGYLLPVLTQDAWLRATVAAHVVASTVFVLGFGTHLYMDRRAPRVVASRREVADTPGSPLPS
jgi:hypothetical protein